MSKLPALTGPPPCVERATAIRARLLRKLYATPPPGFWTADEARFLLRRIAQQDSCTYWIAARSCKVPALYTQMAYRALASRRYRLRMDGAEQTIEQVTQEAHAAASAQDTDRNS